MANPGLRSFIDVVREQEETNRLLKEIIKLLKYIQSINYLKKGGV